MTFNEGYRYRPIIGFIHNVIASVDISFKRIVIKYIVLFKVIGKDAKICSLEFRNRDGQLKPREQLQIELMLCAKKKVFI